MENPPTLRHHDSDYWEDILAIVSDAIISYNQNMEILQWNQAAEAIFGYSRSETMGKNMGLVSPDPSALDPDALLCTGPIASRIIESRLRRKNGALFDTEFSFSIRRLASGAIITLVVRDITERKKSEQARNEQLKGLKFLSESATRLLENMPSDEIFRYVAEQLHAISGRSFVIISEYLPETNQTVVKALAGPEQKVLKLNAILGRSPVGLAFTVAPGTRGRMLRGSLANVEGGLFDLTFSQMPLPLCNQLERELEVGPIYAMAFVLGEDFMGTVAILTDRAEGLINQNIIESIVNQAALALKRKRTEEALRKSESALKTLNENLENRVIQRTRQVRDLAKALTLAEQKERQRFSYILHEDLQQILFAINIRFSMLRDQLTNVYSENVNDILELSNLTTKALETCKTLAIEFNPPILRSEGIDASLKWLAHYIEQQYRVSIDVSIEENIKLKRDDERILLVQLAREILVDLTKHTSPRRANLSAGIEQRQLRITISVETGEPSQENREMRAADKPFSIEERIRLFGGTLIVNSKTSLRESVTIMFPFDEENQQLGIAQE